MERRRDNMRAALRGWQIEGYLPMIGAAPFSADDDPCRYDRVIRVTTVDGATRRCIKRRIPRDDGEIQAHGKGAVGVRQPAGINGKRYLLWAGRNRRKRHGDGSGVYHRGGRRVTVSDDRGLHDVFRLRDDVWGYPIIPIARNRP